MKIGSLHSLAAIAAVALALAPATATAQTPAEFYKGKQITLLVSHPAGGGYDTYARFYGRHLGRLMAGNPNIVVQNMPGAAGVAMTNHLFHQAAKDGTVIGLGAGPLATAPLMGAVGARYDARQLSWIGSMNAEVATAIAWHTHPVKTAKDLYDTELVIAAGGATDISAMSPIALNRLLGMKIKTVTGYAGSAGQVLALERGEVGGIGGYNYGSLKSVRPDWLKEKKVNILLQYAFEAHPDLPNVPTLPQLARNDEEKAILALIFEPQKMGRPIFGPPGIPADRLKALRDAFDAFVKDAAVLAESEKTQTELYRPMRGEDMAKLVVRLHETPPAVVKKAAEMTLPIGGGGAKAPEKSPEAK
jgi:tripartite-type tricarboxylate transporter receptor subunit TctC